MSDPGPQRGRLVATLAIAGIVHAPLAAARLVLPMIALAMGASLALAGVISALFTAAPVLFSLSFGRWADRSGTLRPLVFSAVLTILAALAFLLAPSAQILLVTASLVGAGVVFAHVVATRAVGECGPPQDRARNLGLMVLGYALAQFAGPMLAGAVLERFGASAALAVIGGFGVLTLAALAGVRHNYTTEFRALPEAKSRGRVADLVALPALRKWVIAASTFAGVMTLYPFVVAIHAVGAGFSAVQAGGALGAFAGGNFVSRVVMPVLVRRLAPTRLIVPSLLTGGAAFALVPLVERFPVFAALSAVIGLLLGLGGPITLSLIYDASPPERVNEAVGLSMTLSNAIQTALPLLLGVLAAAHGVAPVVWGLAVVMGATAALVRR